MTVKQRQYMLNAMGYDCGSPDGEWGEKSKAACADFQRDKSIYVDGLYGPTTDKTMLDALSKSWVKPASTVASKPTATPQPVPQKQEAATGGGLYGSKYFTRAEAMCRCGKCGGFPAEPSEALVKKADCVREHFGKPAIVSSWVRCPAHNKEVGGVYNSYHLTGRAMDFSIEGVDGDTVLNYVKTLGVHYTYAISGGYIHMDV